MTARERVLAAFCHREPDRTPIFEKLIKSPIADELLGRPCLATNFDAQMQRLAEGDWEGLQLQTARDLVDLSVELGFDMVRLYPNGGPPPEDQRPRRLAEGIWEFAGTVTEVLPSGWLRSRPVQPVAPVPEAEQEAALEAALEQQPPAPVHLEPANLLMMREARAIIEREGHDLAIFSQVYGMGAASLPAFLFRWFVERPALMHRYYERDHVWALGMCERLVAEGAHIIGLGGDLACDLGPIISPAHYREFIMPRIAQQARRVRELGAFATNATDGDIWPIAEEFLLGAEVDGFEEVDFAAGMDLARLKARFGERITFMGNIDIRFELTSGTPDSVAAHTRACIEAGWGRGGHVVMSSNCIHEGCRTDLFLAHLRAYRQYFGLG